MNRVPQIAHDAGYRANGDGSVTAPSGRALKCYIKKGGYRFFNFSKLHGECAVSRLVAYQKFGNSIFEIGMEVRHLDNDSRNDRDGNIAIGTHSQNMMDMPSEMRRTKAGNARRKYDPAKVRQFYQQSGSYRATMQEFGISSKGTLSFIINKAMGPVASAQEAAA